MNSLPDWVNRGVLVYGPRKAGTTLFQNLLDGGDDIVAFPAELKIKYFVWQPDRAGDVATYYSTSRIGTVESRHFSFADYQGLWEDALKKATLRRLSDLIRFDVWAVFSSSKGMPGHPTMWCAKEVGGPTAQIFELWRKLFPAGKALFIVRDPRMITRAVLNDRRRKGRRLSWLKIVRETTDPVRVVAAQSRYLGDPYVLLIAYEDLVENTSAVMAEVAAFLGVPNSAKFTAPTLFGKPVVVRTSSRETTEVFSPATSWRDGLTGREQRIVAAAAMLASLLPRYRVDYPALRRRLRDTS